MKICLCMIVKDEERYIKNCLNSAFKFVDEAIIVDTGSTDKTLNILKEFGEQIQIRHFQWSNDFAAARNFSLQGVTSDWILIIDADQKIVGNPEKLRNILSTSEVCGYNVVEESHTDSGAKAKMMVYTKLFRNNGYQYYRAIHEQLDIDHSLVLELDEEICKIIHYGYLKKDMQEKAKTKRNLAILLAEYSQNPDDAFTCYHLGATYSAMDEYDLSLQYYFRCLELSPKTGYDAYHFLLFKRVAVIYMLLEQFEVCDSFIDSILKSEQCQEFVDFFFLKGLCLKKLQQYEDAKQAFKQCLIIGNTNKFDSLYGRGSFLANLELARIFRVQNDVACAVSFYEQALFDSENTRKEGLSEFESYVKEIGDLTSLQALGN